MKPPQIARALLLAVAGEAWAECVAGDLEEEFAQVCQARDRAAGARWYFWQVARSLAPLVLLRMRSGEPAQSALVALGTVAVPLLLLDRLWCFVYSQIPLKDGIGRAPELLAINLLAACLGAAIAGALGNSRTAKTRALAAGAAAGFAMWASAGEVPALYALLLVATVPASCLLAFGRRGDAMKWVLRIVVGFLLVLMLGVGVLAVVSHRAGAGRMHTAAELIGTPEQIWPWLNEGEKLKQWVSWLVEVRGWDNGGSVGAKRILVMKDENNGGMLMEIAGVCTAYSRPTLLTVQLSAGDDFDGEQSYRLTDLGSGRTRLDVDSHYRFASSLAQLMEPLITAAARKKMAGDLAHLQALVESNSTASAR